jgi:uncharacterized protein (DUF697 family)
MNKKKLPKAVLRTATEMQETGAREIHAAGSASADNVIEMMPKSEPAPVPQTAEAAIRRRRATAIVERFANYSAVGGALPIPLANAAALTTILVRMVKSLSDLYGVPFERNRTRAVVIGLMGAALPTGFATVATSTITYFVPGCNLLGLAVSSVTSSAFARSIGQLYIEHFENGAMLDFRTIVMR